METAISTIKRQLTVAETAQRYALLMRDYELHTKEITGIQVNLMAAATRTITISPNGEVTIKTNLDPVYQALNDQLNVMRCSIFEMLREAYNLPDQPPSTSYNNRYVK